MSDFFGGDAPSHCTEADQDFQQQDPTNNATGRGTAAGQSRGNETLQFDRASGVLLVARTAPANPVVTQMAAQGFF